MKFVFSDVKNRFKEMKPNKIYLKNLIRKMVYYAVARGNKTGIFQNWIFCKDAIDGFPDACFKKFETQEEAGMADRRLPWPRGKGLGGSSLINGMLYLRGHRLDYDRWASLGNTGWSWDEVLPYFQRAMNTERPLPGDGQGGPLWVSELPHDPLSDAFIAAAARAGIKTTADFNGGDNSGAGYFRMNTHRGQRMSTERAYLREAMKRPGVSRERPFQALRREVTGSGAGGRAARARHAAGAPAP